jgi:GntR family transcriptional regulator / MocR family aminotransferase
MARTRTSSSSELLVELRRDGAGSLHGQIERALRAAIRDGRLTPGTTMPSSRALAGQLDVSRGVIVEAYEQLAAEGFLVSQQGGITRVGPTATAAPEATAAPVSYRPRIDFAYGRPDVTQFPRGAWLRSIREVLNVVPSDLLSYGDPRGVPELRSALAAYLNRVRGMAVHPDRVIVCNGFAQAISIVGAVLALWPSALFAVEDPGQRDPIEVAERVGLPWVPVPVDDGGVSVAALDRSAASAVVVTPAHQFPLGSVLAADRRADLVAWARDRDGLIVEDDYDAEYRYDHEPIGAIQGLAPEHVVYCGSASKVLAPGLRLGWLVAPDRLVKPLAAAKEASDRGSPALEQLAFADFLARGEFDHHLRRMRSVYRQRRGVLLRALARDAPELVPAGASAGLHVTAWLPEGVDEEAVVAAARDAGLGIAGLAGYWMVARDRRPGLIFGYGTAGDRAIEEGVATIGALVRASRPTPRIGLEAMP